MGLFRFKLLLEINTRNTCYNIPENDQCKDSSTQERS